MTDDCIFCKIIKGEIPTPLEEETKNLVVFKDIRPQAPTHLLIVPKRHVSDMRADNGVLWVSIGALVVKLAKKLNLKSFRLVHNAGEAAAVRHMHVHLLGEVSVDRKI